MMYNSCCKPEPCDCADCEWERMTKEEKEGEKIDPYTSPKMFYLPNEIKKSHRGKAIIRIVFLNTSIIAPIIMNEPVNPEDLQIKATILEYKRVELRNSNYDYVYVQFEQLDLFKEIYLNIPRPKIIENKRTYI